MELRYICDNAEAWLRNPPLSERQTFKDAFESWWWRDQNKSVCCYVYRGSTLITVIPTEMWIKKYYEGNLKQIEDHFNNWIKQQVLSALAAE